MMHDIVIDEFERHLEGNASKSFHDHLDACEECRAEVAEMTGFSKYMTSLQSDIATAPEPSFNFYNGIALRIEGKQKKDFWGVSALGDLFFRRLAFASLMTLAVLGSYLVTRETSYRGKDAAAIMAQHDPSAFHTEGQDRNYMLVTLATYRQ